MKVKRVNYGLNGFDNFKVEKGFPVPDIRRGSKIEYQKLFNRMEVGDSIYVPTTKMAIRIQAAFKTFGAKCACRKTPDGGARLWEVETNVEQEGVCLTV